MNIVWTLLAIWVGLVVVGVAAMMRAASLDDDRRGYDDIPEPPPGRQAEGALEHPTDERTDAA